MKQTIIILVLVALYIQSASSYAAIVTENVTYQQGETQLKGMVAYDDAIKGKRPGVIVVHEWWGHNEHARNRARMLAEQGYTAFAVDMYGNGKTADHPKDAMAFSKAVGGNPELARARFDAALSELKKHKTVNADNIAAIGFCFGGSIVLNMARQGVDLDGVAVFHGGLATKSPASKGDIKAKVRVYTGAADKMVPPSQIEAFENEMKSAGVEYQVVAYEGAMHAFTNKGADALGQKFGIPIKYNKNADHESWKAMLKFFKEIF